MEVKLCLFILAYRNIKTVRYLNLFLLLLICACANLPKEKLPQYELSLEKTIDSTYTSYHFSNTLKAPLRIWFESSDEALNKEFTASNPILIPPMDDTTLLVDTSKKIAYTSVLGDPAQQSKATKVALPFSAGRKFRLMQGYNSKPSHNTAYSRYALDFDLQVGDTICAATDGFVVGVVEGYKDGGKRKKWRPYANFITLFDPATALYTQYVHLDYMGSFVEVGDQVQAGQAIAISGMTGYTTAPHLHFNVLRTVEGKRGMVSMPLDSIGNYKIAELRRGQWLKNP